MTKEQLQFRMETMLTNLALEITGMQKEKLAEYVEAIKRGLEKQRLTGEKTYEGLVGKQLYDSLYPLKKLEIAKASKVLDLGSGAGLPGLPLKICRPGILLYLMDSNQRKIEFLRETAASLKLEDVFFLPGRAEEWGQKAGHREEYDLVVSKAVAETAALAELALPLLKIGGKALFYKGPRGEQEADMAAQAISVCGGMIENRWFYSLPTGEKRALYLLKKINITPQQYPRSVGKPAHKPIR